MIIITALILIWTISNNERKIAKDFTLLSSSGKYNEATAILAGDALQALAFETLSNIKSLSYENHLKKWRFFLIFLTLINHPRNEFLKPWNETD